MRALIALVVLAMAISATRGEIIDVSEGLTRVMFDTEVPHVFYYGRKGVDMSANHMSQAFTYVGLLDDDKAEVSDLSDAAGSGDSGVHEADETYTAWFYRTYGSAESGAVLGSINYLMRQDLPLSKIYIDNQWLCATPVTGAGECPSWDMIEGDVKMNLWAYIGGTDFQVPSENGVRYLRISTLYSATGYDGATYYYNDDLTQTTPPEGRLTSATMTHKPTDTEIHFWFEDTFNFNDREVQTMDVTAELTGDGLLVHFDFDLSEVTEAQQFLIYDPIIRTTHVGFFRGVVEAGKTAVALDTRAPLHLWFGRAGTDITQHHVQQEYTGLRIVDADFNEVMSLSDAVTEADNWAFAEPTHFSSGLAAHYGDEDMGIVVGSFNYLARQSLSYSKVPIGDSDLCATPVTAAHTCPDRSVSPGDFKFAVYALTTGDNFHIPDNQGQLYLRMAVDYSMTGFDNVDVYFNRDVAQTAVPDGQLTDITFHTDNVETSWHFEQSWNLDDEEVVGLRITAEDTSSASERSMRVFYDFDLSGVDHAGQTIIYDPVVEITDAGDAGDGDDADADGEDDGEGDVTAASATAASLLAALAAAVAAVQLA